MRRAVAAARGACRSASSQRMRGEPGKGTRDGRVVFDAVTREEAGAGDVGAVVVARVADVEEGEFFVGGEEGAEFVGGGVWVGIFSP